MRSIGMDVHRSFAQVAILDGGKFTEECRIELEHDAVLAFGQRLRKDDEVVLEATGNTAAIFRLLMVAAMHGIGPVYRNQSRPKPPGISHK